MFALCKFKDKDFNFVLYDIEDFKELAEDINIEIEKELSFEEFEKDYSFYPMLYVNDLILRSFNNRSRTSSHILDELGISCWIKLKNEYNLIQEKKSKLSRSQREILTHLYNRVLESNVDSKADVSASSVSSS